MKEYHLEHNIVIDEILEFVVSANNAVTFNYFIDEKLYEVGDCGIVYFLYANVNSDDLKLVYIGKSKGGLFKKRITDHFDHVSESTNSKLELVKKVFENNGSVKLKFIKTYPTSYRSFIEEELIERLKKPYVLWNIQKGKTSP